MSTFDAKFGPAPVPITAPDVRLAMLQFTTLTLITYLSGVCFVIPNNSRRPSLLLAALTSSVVTFVTYMFIVRSNYNTKFSATRS